MKLTEEKFSHILKLQKSLERNQDDSKSMKEILDETIKGPSVPKRALLEYWNSLEELERQELVAMKWMSELEESPDEFESMVEEAKIHTNIAELHKSQLAEYWENAWEKLHAQN